MIRVIFVGMHNKPEMKPLDILTKTGKLINRVVGKLPDTLEIVKTNLWDVDYYVTSDREKDDLHTNWWFQNLPEDDDIIVLLGATVHNEFRHNERNIIKVAHPASKRSHVEMDEYVVSVSNKIIDIAKK